MFCSTYPMVPLENAFNSRFSVDLTLFSEYKPIGELNCLWTIFRWTFAIFILYSLFALSQFLIYCVYFFSFYFFFVVVVVNVSINNSESNTIV